jgi:hypothetical protein
MGRATWRRERSSKGIREGVELGFSSGFDPQRQCSGGHTAFIHGFSRRNVNVTAASTQHTPVAFPAPRAAGRDSRVIVFRGAVALVVLFLGGVVSQLLVTPWRAAGAATPDYIPELHRWHDASIAAFLCILQLGSLLAAIVRPRQTPLLVQSSLAGFVILAGFTLYPLNGPALAIAIVSGGLIFATYPATRALLILRADGKLQRPLLALAIVATVPLLLDAWTNIRLQQIDMSEHATHRHWHGVAAVALALMVTGYLVASQRQGWQVLGAVLGLTYLYLGMAALLIPNHDGSWGVVGGSFSLAGGVAFIVATALTALRARATEPGKP